MISVEEHQNETDDSFVSSILGTNNEVKHELEPSFGAIIVGSHDINESQRPEGSSQTMLLQAPTKVKIKQLVIQESATYHSFSVAYPALLLGPSKLQNRFRYAADVTRYLESADSVPSQDALYEFVQSFYHDANRTIQRLLKGLGYPYAYRPTQLPFSVTDIRWFFSRLLQTTSEALCTYETKTSNFIKERRWTWVLGFCHDLATLLGEVLFRTDVITDNLFKWKRIRDWEVWEKLLVYTVSVPDRLQYYGFPQHLMLPRIEHKAVV